MNFDLSFEKQLLFLLIIELCDPERYHFLTDVHGFIQNFSKTVCRPLLFHWALLLFLCRLRFLNKFLDALSAKYDGRSLVIRSFTGISKWIIVVQNSKLRRILFLRWVCAAIAEKSRLSTCGGFFNNLLHFWSYFASVGNKTRCYLLLRQSAVC